MAATNYLATNSEALRAVKHLSLWEVTELRHQLEPLSDSEIKRREYSLVVHRKWICLWSPLVPGFHVCIDVPEADVLLILQCLSLECCGSTPAPAALEC